MTPDERQDLINRYVSGYDEVTKALQDFPADKLGANAIPGKWSAREIVHHLADSETTAAGRIRKLLVEDNPIIQGYDEAEYARRLKYNERDMAPALEAFRLARLTTQQLFASMTDEDWQRAGTHSESGAYSAETWLTIYAKHAHNHAEQIERLKQAVNI